MIERFDQVAGEEVFQFVQALPEFLTLIDYTLLMWLHDLPYGEVLGGQAARFEERFGGGFCGGERVGGAALVALLDGSNLGAGLGFGGVGGEDFGRALCEIAEGGGSTRSGFGLDQLGRGADDQLSGACVGEAGSALDLEGEGSEALQVAHLGEALSDLVVALLGGGSEDEVHAPDQAVAQAPDLVSEARLGEGYGGGGFDEVGEGSGALAEHVRPR